MSKVTSMDADMRDAERYKEEGYVLAKRFFSKKEVEAIREEAKQIFIAQMVRHGIITNRPLPEAEFERGMFDLFQKDLQSFVNCGKQAQHLISLHRLSLDERIIQAIRHLGLQWPNISTRPLLYFNSPKLAKKEVYWRLSAHQDWRSMQGSLDAIVVWIALIDIDKSLGTLEVIPKSHCLGLLESEMEEGYGHITECAHLTGFTPVDVEAGDALFFSAFLAHRSGTMTTDSIRWSCHFRYNNLHEKTFLERGFPHPYVYHPQTDLITKDFPASAQVKGVFS
jgi:ectoine hydroxylase-related dioxygenase (phytanoyl-CoA dioxygenase family)